MTVSFAGCASESSTTSIRTNSPSCQLSAVSVTVDGCATTRGLSADSDTVTPWSPIGREESATRTSVAESKVPSVRLAATGLSLSAAGRGEPSRPSMTTALRSSSLRLTMAATVPAAAPM